MESKSRNPPRTARKRAPRKGPPLGGGGSPHLRRMGSEASPAASSSWRPRGRGSSFPWLAPVLSLPRREQGRGWGTQGRRSRRLHAVRASDPPPSGEERKGGRGNRVQLLAASRTPCTCTDALSTNAAAIFMNNFLSSPLYSLKKSYSRTS